MSKHLWVAAILASAAALSVTARQSPAADYYFSPSGSDANAGTSSSPYATIGKLNSLNLGAGDTVYLEGGGSFNGNIVLNQNDNATNANGDAAGAPIRITTYGSGQAVINAGLGTGLKATNNGNIEVSNLKLIGQAARFDNGAQKYIYDNTGDGISFTNSLGGDVKLQNVKVNNVTVQDFGKNGVWFGASSGQSGYRNVEVQNVVAHSNQLAGIAMAGSFNTGNRNNFSNVYIANNQAFRNYGVDADTSIGNTGNGIVIGQVTDAVVEKNVAYENGTRCVSTQGGPVGIWTWDSSNIVIQKNYSHHNGTGGLHDGGGFDLDGGVINSVMQYNFSDHNDGAGFLLAQFQGAKDFKNNIVRFNISQNDGRKNGYGAIHAFGTVTDTDVYNNTIFMSPTEKDIRNDGPQAGVKLRLFSGDDLRLFNNLFLLTKDDNNATHDPEMVNANAPGIQFARNAYWLNGESGVFNSADLQAMYLDDSNPPDLFGPIGEAPVLNSADQLTDIIEYTLNNSSPLVNHGLDLFKLYGIDTGLQDFYGTLRHDVWDVGAAETLIGDPPRAPLPEPASLGVLMMGAAGMLRRRRPRPR